MKNDQIIFDLIAKEDERQRNGIELIASENSLSGQGLSRESEKPEEDFLNGKFNAIKQKYF